MKPILRTIVILLVLFLPILWYFEFQNLFREIFDIIGQIITLLLLVSIILFLYYIVKKLHKMKK